MLRISEQEIRRRIPVWTALTDLFLDTEPTSTSYRYIARVSAEAGYTAEQLHAILLHDVAPVFQWNLFSVAGEWAGWSERYVESKLRPLVQSRDRSGGLTLLLSKRLTRDAWRNLQPFLQASQTVCTPVQSLD